MLFIGELLLFMLTTIEGWKKNSVVDQICSCFNYEFC